jgi:hypothetical protein
MSEIGIDVCHFYQFKYAPGLSFKLAVHTGKVIYWIRYGTVADSEAYETPEEIVRTLSEKTISFNNNLQGNKFTLFIKGKDVSNDYVLKPDDAETFLPFLKKDDHGFPNVDPTGQCEHRSWSNIYTEDM